MEERCNMTDHRRRNKDLLQLGDGTRRKRDAEMMGGFVVKTEGVQERIGKGMVRVKGGTSNR
jgi:hypothetical protein